MDDLSLRDHVLSELEFEPSVSGYRKVARCANC